MGVSEDPRKVATGPAWLTEQMGFQEGEIKEFIDPAA